jgi:serine phosphatase RsbU (regulator of sigma subunit)
LSPGAARPCAVDPGLVLGVLPGVPCPATEVALEPGDWGMLLYTDGLVEGRAVAGSDDDRLGVDGLCRLFDAYDGAARPPRDLPGWLHALAEARNGGPLADDVAMLLAIAGGAAW